MKQLSLRLCLILALPISLFGQTNDFAKVKTSELVISKAIPNETERDIETKTTVSVQSKSGQPLKLRNGAIPTGLQGFYDHQSNGYTPGYIETNPNQPSQIHTTYMLSLGGNTLAEISSQRRVGYAYSSDGGITWASTKEIQKDFRLGFPFLQLNKDGTPLIAVHGNAEGKGAQSMIYMRNGEFNFNRATTMKRESVGGNTAEDGAGVIWPCLVIDQSSTSNAVVIGSLSPTKNSNLREGLHVQNVKIGSNDVNFKLITNKDIGTTDLGNYRIARSNSGKIGVVWSHLTPSIDVKDILEKNGLYFSESTDYGANWSEPVKVLGYMTSGKDTVNQTNTNMDLVYVGEDAMIASGNSTVTLMANSSGSQLTYKYASMGLNIWSAKLGVRQIARANPSIGLGLVSSDDKVAQPNMDWIDFPSLSVGDDSKHIAVIFQAAAQTTKDGNTVGVTNKEGFHYFRLWCVASDDGGQTWGSPFIVQDFAANGTDSASIEYPSSVKNAKIVGNEMEITTAFQARREPGMYALTAPNAKSGTINECFQYFQKVKVTAANYKSVNNSNLNEKGSINISAYPNPTNGTSRVQYRLPAAGVVVIKLINSLGEEIKTITNNHGFPGTYTQDFNFAELNSGVYSLVITQNEVTNTHHLNVVK